MAAADSLLIIGRLAERANVTTSMLRFYEREGLLRPTRRTSAGYRLYAADAENTLLFIRRAQRLGFSLDDIKLVLAGGSRRGGHVHVWRESDGYAVLIPGREAPAA